MLFFKRKLLKELEEVDQEVISLKTYLKDNIDKLSSEEVSIIENDIELAERRYLLLTLKRA